MMTPAEQAVYARTSEIAALANVSLLVDCASTAGLLAERLRPAPGSACPCCGVPGRDSYPLAHVQVDGFDKSFVFGGGELAPEPERGA